MTTKATSTKIQSVIFHKDKGWDKQKSAAWIKNNGFQISKRVDETPHYLRFRQKNPDQKKKLYRWKDFSKDKGISAIIEIKKGGRKK
tara:strand:- start:836 stop:1096 length:261 start_codon:yes stop_codon:yes gene_type:complete